MNLTDLLQWAQRLFSTCTDDDMNSFQLIPSEGDLVGPIQLGLHPKQNSILRLSPAAVRTVHHTVE